MTKDFVRIAGLIALCLASCEPAVEAGDDSRGAGGTTASAGAAGVGPAAGAGSGGVGTGGSAGAGAGFGSGGSGNPAGGAIGSGGSGGASGNGTDGGSGGGGGGGSGGGAGPVSDLPVPPGPSVPKPAGAPGNLSVLNWAGFGSAVSYTFDDALSSQSAHYAELQATGVRMTFYVVSGNGASSGTWMQAAADGHEIANHTAHHCHDNGSGCAWGTYAGSLAAEFEQCTSYIIGLGVAGVWTSAAPYGDPGFATAAEAAFFLNRGVNGGQVGANDNTNPFSLPCHMAAEGELASGFNSATDSARASGKWQLFLIHSLGGDGGYNPVATSDVVASVNHATSLGDVWVDSVVNVGAYWRAQKVFSGITPTTSGSDTTYSWTLPAHFPPGKFVRVTVSGGTLKQAGATLAWNDRGYYEVALDAGSLTLSP